MKSNNYTIYFYLRILFCISIVLIWSLWLITRPEDKKHKSKFQTQSRIPKKIAQRKERKKNTEVSYNFKIPTEEVIAVQKSKQITEDTNQKQDTKEKPVDKRNNIEIVHQKQNVKEKLIDKKTEKEIARQKEDIKEKPNSKKNNTETVKQKQSNTQKAIATTILTQPTPTNITSSTPNPNSSPGKTPSHTNIDINLPTIATATRKALSNTAPNNSTTTVKNKISAEKQNQKAFDPTNDLNSNTSWLPEYPEEKDSKDLDKIVEQLELTEIISTNNEKTNAAKIKNNISNKIEIVKQGDEYEGLKLIEVRINEIVLSNQNLNKTYIKKLNKSQ